MSKPCNYFFREIHMSEIKQLSRGWNGCKRGKTRGAVERLKKTAVTEIVWQATVGGYIVGSFRFIAEIPMFSIWTADFVGPIYETIQKHTISSISVGCGRIAPSWLFPSEQKNWNVHLLLCCLLSHQVRTIQKSKYYNPNLIRCNFYGVKL